jgi:hypothetical protein
MLSGNTNKSFPAGTLTVAGNLTVASGISLKGAPNNGTNLKVGGDLNITGTPAIVAPDFGIKLELTKTGTQTITTGGDLYLQSINPTGTNAIINVLNTGTPATLHLGSYNGGGLTLANGTKLNLGNNKLVLSRSAVINPSNETGRIGINGGELDITSNSASNSHLYFDPANHSAKYLGLNLTGTGDALIHEDLSVTEAIKIKNGELNSSGHITLISNAANTANIQEIEGTGIITGDMKVQRYFAPKGKVYRYISTAVEGVTVADWQAYFPITGPFVGGSTGFTNNPSMFIYDNEAWVEYPLASGSNQDLIKRGVGYSAYLRNGTSPMTIQVTGNPYQGNIPFVLDPDPSASSTDGWNLLGNPYASTIVWNNSAWIKSGINSTIAVRDNPTGNFKYYDANTGLGGAGIDDDLSGGKIAPGQAFWVQTFTATPSLTITEKAKSTEQQTFFREQSNPVSHLTLSLKQGLKEDRAFVAFTEIGTDAFDKEFDAMKQQNVGLFNFSTLSSNNIATAINNMSDEFCTKTVKLNIQNVSAGTYSLEFSDIGSLIGVDKVVLHDNFTNADVDISEGTQYSFSVTSNANTFGSNRLKLTFTRPEINASLAVNAADVCGDQEALVKVGNSQQGVEYHIVNSNNEVISETMVGTGSSISITLPSQHLTPGENTLRISGGYKGCNNQLLNSNVTLNFTVAPVAVVEEQNISVCSGASATLTATGTATGSYNWYDMEGNKVSGAARLEVSTILEYKEYYVSAVAENGCEGPKTIVTINPETLETPSITFYQDTLYSTGIGLQQWYKDGAPISGANEGYYVPDFSGSYSVEQIQNSCGRMSESFEITGVENETGNSAFNLSVYPNPSKSDDLNVRIFSLSHSDVKIGIMDIVGKYHYNNTFEYSEAVEGIQLTPIDPLSNGVYFVIVVQGKETIKRKIIITQ